MNMVQTSLLVLASTHISLVAAGVDPFKSTDDTDKWLKEAEDLVKVDSGSLGSTKSSLLDKDDFDPDKILKELELDKDPDIKMPDLKSMEDNSIGSIADAINDGAMGGNMNLPELTTVSYENDPMHKNDPLKDPNSDKVLTELGLTEEEKERLRNEPREETTVDVAIRECYDETHAHGCTDNESPIRCLATAVRQKAADISRKCRRSTEKALPYACSVELFITHCDGVEQPLIQCLDTHHPKLGPECLDFLVITKKVVKTLKKKPKPVREEESNVPSIIMMCLAVIMIGFAVYFYRGGSLQDLGYHLNVKKLQGMILRTEVRGGVGKGAGGQEWIKSLDEDRDDKRVQLNNFANVGGSNYGGISSR